MRIVFSILISFVIVVLLGAVLFLYAPKNEISLPSITITADSIRQDGGQ